MLSEAAQALMPRLKPLPAAHGQPPAARAPAPAHYILRASASILQAA